MIIRIVIRVAPHGSETAKCLSSSGWRRPGKNAGAELEEMRLGFLPCELLHKRKRAAQRQFPSRCGFRAVSTGNVIKGTSTLASSESG